MGTFTVKTAQGVIQVPEDKIGQYADPNQISQWTKNIAQPQAGLESTQLGNAREAAQLPAVAAQSQAATTNIPVQQPAAPPTQDAIKNIKSVYQNAWQKAKTTTERDSIAGSFKQATGNDLYQLYLPQGQLDSVTQTLAAKQQIGLIKEGMQADPNLKKVIGNPIWDLLIKTTQGFPGGLATIQKTLGISDKGMQALSGFIKLQGVGDRQLVGGRLSGYMTDFFGNAQPGLGRSVSDNLNQLSNMQDAIDKNLNVYAKNTGFQKWEDIPGLSAYKDKSTTFQIKKL